MVVRRLGRLWISASGQARSSAVPNQVPGKDTWSARGTKRAPHYESFGDAKDSKGSITMFVPKALI